METKNHKSATAPVVQLRENADEYLLFVPFALKERAKAIFGRRWDPPRQCWVYPRTRETHDALVAEFGDEAALVEITPPGAPEVVERLSVPAPPQLPPAPREPGIPMVPAEVAKALERERDALRVALEERARRTAELEDQIRTLSRQQTVEKGRSIAGYGLAWVRQVLKDAASGSEEFAEILGGLQLDERAPVELTKHLARKLAVLMGFTPEARLPDLSDLISQARDSETIGQDAFHLAHLIRTQRNVLVHQTSEPAVRRARVLLVMAAAALLWPMLPASPRLASR